MKLPQGQIWAAIVVIGGATVIWVSVVIVALIAAYRSVIG
jgi:hypothetical protein